MADHKAEQVIVGVVAAVQNLTTTGTNVRRGRSVPLDDDQFTGLSVHLGPDEPIDDSGWPNVHSDLTVLISAHARGSDEDIDTVLNQIRKEVTIALWVDPMFGLSFILDMTEGATDEPEIDSESGYITGRMRTAWIIRYDRNRMDPSL